MASSEPEQAPEVAPQGQPAATPERRRGAGWLLPVIGAAAILGLLVGVGIVLRGRSIGPNSPADAQSGPTFVIAAVVSPAPVGSPSPVVEGSPTAQEYVVQPGDTLRSIAETVYGDADQWRRIYDANLDVIGPDPDTLQTGTRLRIPE